MASGNVSVTPGMNPATMTVAPNSPSALAKDNRMPAEMPRRASGRVMRKNTFQGERPRLEPASSNVRGTSSNAVRMERTNDNAQIIAEYLADHPKVKRTIYPGLKSHPHHNLARKQMKGFGGLISFDVGSLDNAKQVLERLRLMALAESLGGVETLISHPAIMTHASVPKDRRDMLGISDGLIRISVGIEDVEDLQADLEQALSAL